MLARWRRWFVGELRWARRRPWPPLLALAAMALAAYVIVTPLGVSRYPMMTDLPFHTAYAAIARHYLDPAWHFREQFTFQPLAVPYLATYVIAALLMTVLPAVVAMKAAVAVMLALLPAGLAVMFYGMRKSPLLGLTGLGFVWGGLTSWGFVNFMGALGLFAMVIGLTMRLLDQPTRRLQWLLSGALVAVFFTHVFRFPFAVAAVVATTVLLQPATRRWRPVVGPLLTPLALLALWWWIRPSSIATELGPLTVEWPRLGQAGGFLYRSLRDPREAQAATDALAILLGLASGLALLFVLQDRLAQRPKRDWAWGIGVTLVPLGCAAVFLLLFLTLPMQIGIWWYVYPREITAAAFIALGALPDLPRQRWLQAAYLLVVAFAVVPLTGVVIDAWSKFDAATRDFDAIVAHIPQAPKLMYLVFDHRGTTAIHTPFIHLPAYVQATRGGWLSFHFATWGASPIVYRSTADPTAVVPPPTPLRWEWTPHRFHVRRHGAFFDWFLVRRHRAPDHLFRLDPSIQRVAREGSWWLYRRSRARDGGETDAGR